MYNTSTTLSPPTSSVRYLASNVMRATSSSLALAASVLGFEITELWTEDAEGIPKCIYVHAEEEIVKVYPDILVGHYPNHKKNHVVSPNLCKLAKDSPDGGYWKIHASDNYSKGDETLHLDSGLSIRTEMSFMLQYHNDEEIKNGPKVYIIGFSTQKIHFSAVKFKFLSGLGYAIYVAAFDLDEEKDALEDKSLDMKAFQPRVKSSLSLVNLHGLETGSGGTSRKGSMDSIKSLVNSNSNSNDDTEKGSKEEGAELILKNIVSLDLSADESLLEMQQEGWDLDVFSFPVSELEIKNAIPHNLIWTDFKKVCHIAEGSNANVFLAYWNNEKVIIKMIKEHVEYDPVAVHEFLMEQSILTRLSHPNIIRILGSGTQPRRFIVLEFLGGGSLNSILDQSKQGIAHRLFRRPSFTYQSLFAKARDISEAFKYLHCQLSEKAMIIHRDLKPDNVGFTSAGTLKLFDFGLCTCVKKRTLTDEAYEMSGNTGSLRYMAPEVALGLPYTEKADVYSFGIMIWQMARDRVPFKGMSREEFMKSVVKGGERPKLDKSWPIVFSKLLTDCWHKDPLKRPSFATIVTELTSLIDEENGKSWARRGKIHSTADKTGGSQEKATPSRSTWF